MTATRAPGPLGRALALAALCWLLAVVPAQADTQTTLDPNDAFPDLLQLTDVRSITWDTTTQPGKLLLHAELQFAADRAMLAVAYLDSGGDGKADYAIEISPINSVHPDAGGMGGVVRYRLRHVTASTTSCQSYDDGAPFEDPGTYDAVAATLDAAPLGRGSPFRSTGPPSATRPRSSGRCSVNPRAARRTTTTSLRTPPTGSRISTRATLRRASATTGSALRSATA